MPDRAPLRPDRARFVAALLSGLGVERAAVAAGRDRSTGFRWAKREDVTAALAEGQRAGREVASLVLEGAALEAAEVVRELMGRETDPQTRLRAATVVLDRVGLTAPMPDDGDGESAVVSTDGSWIQLGGVRYSRDVTPRPIGHGNEDGEPAVTDAEGEEDHTCDE
jgi:hypothetical protein